MKTSETKFESYDAKGALECNEWEFTFRSEPPKIKNSPIGEFLIYIYSTQL